MASCGLTAISVASADDAVLDPLTEERELAPLERDAVHRGDRLHRRDLERGGGADALARRHGGVHDDAHAVRRHEPALASQHHERAGDVTRPGARPVGAEQGARRVVVERDAARKERVDRDGDFTLVPRRRDGVGADGDARVVRALCRGGRRDA